MSDSLYVSTWTLLCLNYEENVDSSVPDHREIVLSD